MQTGLFFLQKFSENNDLYKVLILFINHLLHESVFLS